MLSEDEGIEETADLSVPGRVNSILLLDSNSERIFLLFLIIPVIKDTKAILEKLFCLDALLLGDNKAVPLFCELLKASG